MSEQGIHTQKKRKAPSGITFPQILLGLWFSLSIGSCLQAQTNDEMSLWGATKGGLKAGVNFAELWGEDALPESDRKVGYSFGGFASIPLTQHLKLQAEAIWSLQGESSKESGRYKISYINIPLMVKWTEGPFFTEIGPQVGLLTINTTSSVPDEIRLDNFETFDLSLNIGCGYQVFEAWSVGLRYSQGLTNLVDGKDLKNSVIYLGLAYHFL